jgi:hypothetical protein
MKFQSRKASDRSAEEDCRIIEAPGDISSGASSHRKV